MEKPVKGNIRLTDVPDGEAPEEIRREWVGDVILPVVAITDEESRGVVSHDEVNLGESYLVPQKAAIAALRKKSKKAAAWWGGQGFPKMGQYFNFKVSQAEIVGTLEVLPFKIRQHLGLLEVGCGYQDHEANLPDSWKK